MIAILLPVQWIETRTPRDMLGFKLSISQYTINTICSDSSSRPRNLIDVQQKLYEIHVDGADSDIVMSTSTHWNEW